jgi:hypothetical protein
MKTRRTPTTCAAMITPGTKVYSPNLIVKFIIALGLLLSVFAVQTNAQCTAPSMTFNSPVLISGTDGQIGAVYLFANVMTGVDAHIEIMDMVGGAALAEIDNTSGAGYYDAFQPYVVAGGYDTSYIDWKITFKIAGTSTDILLPCLAVTGVDVDGDASALQEFIEAATPGSFAVDPFTNLQVSFDGVRSKAVSPIANIPSIDTARREGMFQMNFTNISTLLYRNGSITTGGSQTRQTCIYFKSFFDNFTMILPSRITSFTAVPTAKGAILNWSATNEEDTRNYTVQKSNDANLWKNTSVVTAGIGHYTVTDFEKNTSVVYYRLQQTSNKGIISFSKVVKVNVSSIQGVAITHNSIVSNTVNLQLTAATADSYTIEIYTIDGHRVKQQQDKLPAGTATTVVNMPAGLNNGIYVLSVKNNQGLCIYSSKLVKS